MHHLHSVRWQPALNPRQSAVRLCWLIVALAAACADSAPPTAVKLTPPDSALKSMAVPTDWYDCWSDDGGSSWTCAWSHTEWSMPDWWDHPVKQWLTTTPDCQSVAKAAYCDSQLFGPESPYTDLERYPLGAEWDDKEWLPIPTCPVGPTASPQSKAYCAGKTLKNNASQLALVRQALDRMAQIPGCGTLAELGHALISQPDAIRVFPQSTFKASGAVGARGGGLPENGGPSGYYSWLVIANTMFAHYDAAHKSPKGPKNPYHITLQWTLAHELDHLLGEPHLRKSDDSEDEFMTVNTARCSDIPNAYQ
jgi:hypothetical protein